MSTPSGPLRGVRVLNLGGIWAGRLASMLLADQGADVIEINRPGRSARPEDVLLTRGKRSVDLDLQAPEDRLVAFELACEADIVFDNLGPGQATRFGLDHPRLVEANPGVVYVAIPGFASTTAQANVPAWEGVIDASLGVYTDLHATGALLGGDPIYTAVPMASSYGAVHAAISATLAYLHRLNTGFGQRVEVPLADALMAGMALLVMRIEGQPERFDLPAIDKCMTEVAFPILRNLTQHLTAEHRAAIGAYLKQFAKPLFAHYKCRDGRIVFLNALDHVHHSRAALETLGVLDQLISEGMVLGSPYEEGGAGNNIGSAATLEPRWMRRIHELLTSRFATRPADEWCTLLQEANVPCARVRTSQEWLADPVVRESGCVARVESNEHAASWQAGRFVSIGSDCSMSPPLAGGVKVDRGVQWPQRSRTAAVPVADIESERSGILDGVRVLDLSNVIAGPVSARTLAEFGADVIRVDAPAPQAGPRMTMWFGVDVNQGKRAIIVDLKSHKGREVLADLVRSVDVVIHNFLDRSVDGIGISVEQLRAIKPDIICCQVSAWAGPDGGKFKDFPAFDPVLQAATGITARYGSPTAPVMHGVASCVDYITGFTAALGIAQALVAKKSGDGGAFVRTSLAMGAQLVQFPFMVDDLRGEPVPSGQHQRGSAAHHSMYQSKSGWVFLACRPEDLCAVAHSIGATATSTAAMSEAMASHSLVSLAERLRPFKGAAVTAVKPLEQVRSERSVAVDATEQVDVRHQSTPLVDFDHPSGYRTTLPVPSWSRGGRFALRRLSPAPMPGQHTRSVLSNLKYDLTTVDSLFEFGVVRDGWAAVKRYFVR